MAAAMGIGRFAYTPLLPQMAAEFDWNYSAAGDVASANFLGYLLGAILAPALARSPQVRLWVAASLVGSVATTALGAVTTEYTLWLALRFASGVASAFCLVVITTHLMAALSRYESGHLGNVHFAGVGLGIMISVFVALDGYDVATQWSRQGGAAAFLMLLAWLLLSRQRWDHSQLENTAELSSPVAQVSTWQLVVGYGLFGYGYVVSATFLVAMAEQVALVGTFSDARLLWLVVGGATIPSVYLWQWYAQKRGLVDALFVSYLVLTVGTYLAGTVQGAAGLIFAAALLGGTFGGITALGLSLGRAIEPHRIAEIVSTMTVAFSIGQLLGPGVSGRLADLLGGFMWPSLLAAFVTLLGAALIWTYRKVSVRF